MTGPPSTLLSSSSLSAFWGRASEVLIVSFSYDLQLLLCRRLFLLLFSSWSCRKRPNSGEKTMQVCLRAPLLACCQLCYSFKAFSSVPGVKLALRWSSSDISRCMKKNQLMIWGDLERAPLQLQPLRGSWLVTHFCSFLKSVAELEEIFNTATKLCKHWVLNGCSNLLKKLKPRFES